MKTSKDHSIASIPIHSFCRTRTNKDRTLFHQRNAQYINSPYWPLQLNGTSMRAQKRLGSRTITLGRQPPENSIL
jgi:hypothetical protein